VAWSSGPHVAWAWTPRPCGVDVDIKAACGTGRDVEAASGMDVDVGAMCGAGRDIEATRGTGWGDGAARGMATVSEVLATEEG
jgi:hypothetical protein